MKVKVLHIIINKTDAYQQYIHNIWSKKFDIRLHRRRTGMVQSYSPGGCTDRDVVWDMDWGGPKEPCAHWRHVFMTTQVDR